MRQPADLSGQQVVDHAMHAREYKQATLAQQLQQKILDYVDAAGLQAGDRLPTEPELCALFQVSRTAVREAMKCLQILGIVSIEPGRGTFLLPFEIGKLLSRLPVRLLFRREDILEMIRVRQTLEELCVEQAVVHGSEADFERLGACVEVMRQRAARGEAMVAEDIEFHRLLAEIADARLLQMILEVFWQLRLRLPSDQSRTALRNRYERHARLYQAIRRRDLQLARFYLAEHFSGFYEELLGFLDPVAAIDRPQRTGG